MSKYKTLCCKSSYNQIGCATIICDKCKEDVTMELIYLELAINENRTKKSK